ncbi:MAG: hypothetical protein EP318_16355 [Rhodobacteraceae bacterium]|nr:MAG: hypothetical protein EP318_16355 [Paracoccaceae bacterium]
MKFILAGTAFALMASVAHAQQTALDLVLAQTPVPCGGSDNIAAAEFDTNDAGQRIVRVRCRSAGLFGNAPAGAPATNFGFLAPVLGIGLAGAAVGLGGGGGGSSSSDTQ